MATWGDRLLYSKQRVKGTPLISAETTCQTGTVCCELKFRLSDDTIRYLFPTCFASTQNLPCFLFRNPSLFVSPARHIYMLSFCR